MSIICALLIEGISPSDSMWQIEFTHAAVYGFILINLIIIVTFVFDEALTTRMVSHQLFTIFNSYDRMNDIKRQPKCKIMLGKGRPKELL